MCLLACQALRWVARQWLLAGHLVEQRLSSQHRRGCVIARQATRLHRRRLLLPGCARHCVLWMRVHNVVSALGLVASSRQASPAAATWVLPRVAVAVLSRLVPASAACPHRRLRRTLACRRIWRPATPPCRCRRASGAPSRLQPLVAAATTWTTLMMGTPTSRTRDVAHKRVPLVPGSATVVALRSLSALLGHRHCAVMPSWMGGCLVLAVTTTPAATASSTAHRRLHQVTPWVCTVMVTTTMATAAASSASAASVPSLAARWTHTPLCSRLPLGSHPWSLQPQASSLLATLAPGACLRRCRRISLRGASKTWLLQARRGLLPVQPQPVASARPLQELHRSWQTPRCWERRTATASALRRSTAPALLIMRTTTTMALLCGSSMHNCRRVPVKRQPQRPQPPYRRVTSVACRPTTRSGRRPRLWHVRATARSCFLAAPPPKACCHRRMAAQLRMSLCRCMVAPGMRMTTALRRTFTVLTARRSRTATISATPARTRRVGLGQVSRAETAVPSVARCSRVLRRSPLRRARAWHVLPTRQLPAQQQQHVRRLLAATMTLRSP